MSSTLLKNSQPNNLGGIKSLLTLVVALALSVAIWLNHQYLVDAISVWRYQPSSEVARIVDETQLSDKGKFIFYAVHPQVNDREKFNQVCEHKESGTAILGCYVNNRIYIFNVTDERLDGIKEVTAAHELLHAAYERLSSGERSKVDKLVDAEYKKLSDEDKFAERMAFYARTEPGERNNELHSIIGTEVTTISPELEEHYSKYFEDRAAIVALHDQYDSEFTALANQAEQLSRQLDQLRDQIKAATNKYATSTDRLSTDIEEFNRKARGGGFATPTEFNNERQALLNRVADVRAERDSINAMVDRYNKLREQYNSVATQSNDLYKSINSNLAPAPNV